MSSRSIILSLLAVAAASAAIVPLLPDGFALVLFLVPTSVCFVGAVLLGMNANIQRRAHKIKDIWPRGADRLDPDYLARRVDRRTGIILLHFAAVAVGTLAGILWMTRV